MSDQHQQRALELARRNAQRYTSRYRSLLLRWLGRTFRRPAPVEPAQLPPVDAGQVAVTWGGHATALIRYQRLSVLCDPVLARSVSGVPREISPGLTLDALADVDLVLITHAAPDHLDLATLSRLSRSATVVVPPRAAARISPLRFARLVELSVGHSLMHRGLEIWAEEARHGQRKSPAQSYIMRGDGPTVYYCGASGYHAGFGDIGRRHWPDVAILPIGGYWPRSFRKRHMSPLDALYAFEDLRARVMVPIGYGTFALSYERMNDPERWLSELVAERHLERFVVRLETGETRVFVPPGTTALESGRFEVDSAGPTTVSSQAALAILEQEALRPITTRRPVMPLSAPPADPLPAAATRTPVPATRTPVPPAEPGPPPAPRRPPALIVDPDDQDDETGVFDQPSALRGHAQSGAGVLPSVDDDEDDDDAHTRALMELPEADSEPVPLPVPGSR